MKNLLSLLILLTCLQGVSFSQVSLFDGKSLSGWYMDVPDLQKDSSLRRPFIVRDGLLVSLGTPGGHLISDKSYEDYILEFKGLILTSLK
jgi:hypothetical protein